MLDFSVGNQLDGMYGVEPGLFLPQAYPYVIETGDVYSIAVFESGAGSSRRSMLDWESEVLTTFSTGTIAIASGIVTLSGGGGGFVAYGTNPVYSRRLYVGDVWYEVYTRDSATQLTLVNTAVNVAGGTSYKYTIWEYRENNPYYAVTGEFEFAQDEAANALDEVTAIATANPACGLGWYEYPCGNFWREGNRIADDLANWLIDLDAALDYVTASGYKLIDKVKSMGGEVYWNNYLPDAYLATTPLREKWLRRNQHIMESLAERGIPNRPLFRPLTLDGVGTFETTAVGTAVPDDYQLEMLAAVQAYQPYKIALWGTVSDVGSGSVDEWDTDAKTLFEDYFLSLAPGRSASSPAVSPVIPTPF